MAKEKQKITPIGAVVFACLADKAKLRQEFEKLRAEYQELKAKILLSERRAAHAKAIDEAMGEFEASIREVSARDGERTVGKEEKGVTGSEKMMRAMNAARADAHHVHIPKPARQEND